MHVPPASRFFAVLRRHTCVYTPALRWIPAQARRRYSILRYTRSGFIGTTSSYFFGEKKDVFILFTFLHAVRSTRTCHRTQE